MSESSQNLEENRSDLVRNEEMNHLEEETPLTISDLNRETERIPALARPESDLEEHNDDDDRFFENPNDSKPMEVEIFNANYGLLSRENNNLIFPYAPTFVVNKFGYRFDLETIPDVNIYQHKKTVAQGMMDLALFSTNANQLRYVLEKSNHPYYYAGVVLISISLAFQVIVGIGLILNTRYNVKDEKQICIANKVNNFTIIGIFLVTVINVFISAFGVAVNSVAMSATN